MGNVILRSFPQPPATHNRSSNPIDGIFLPITLVHQCSLGYLDFEDAVPSVDRPSYPELCPSQPLPPLHLHGSMPRPGRPTQCFPCGSLSHDVTPLGLIHRIASTVGVSTLECPRWSVHAGVSTLECPR